MSKQKNVLIANRGEIAVRIARAAKGLGINPISIFAPADSDSLHTKLTPKAVELSGKATDPVSAYLDLDQIVSIAKENECEFVHPGYGFLSENAVFAKKCSEQGIEFIGPEHRVLKLFGDKVQARQLAESLSIPTIPGSKDALDSIGAAKEVAQEIGYPIMLKASSGGGGRGMRAVTNEKEMEEAFERCASEAKSSFGDERLFLEKLIERPRHIEIQILADKHGDIIHLFERDCSIQERNQKVIEIAPAPNLDPTLLDQLYKDAKNIAKETGYTNAGTVEFLVTPETGEYFFIECNPRIQVEHTITEEITGVDLVETQFRISLGETLTSMNLDKFNENKRPSSFAIQARVVSKGNGTLLSYREPSGPGVRVDSAAYPGLTPPPFFDPLLAKLICSSNSSGSFESAIQRTINSIDEFYIDGLPTNLFSLKALLSSEELAKADARTDLIENSGLTAKTKDESRSPAIDLFEKKSPSSASSIPKTLATLASNQPALDFDPTHQAVECPMAGAVIDLDTKINDQVKAGDTLMVISAMKMETAVTAPCNGQIKAMLDLTIGDTVTPGQIVAAILPEGGTLEDSIPEEQTWTPLLREVSTLQSIAHKRFSADTQDPGVLRQRSRNKLTCRERIDLLLDSDSFREVGSLAGFASYDEEGAISDFTPANHVGGWGTINQRTTIVCADDFTSRGGHSDGAIGQKSGYLDRLSMELKVPSVRLLDGSSGGGSVASMVPQQKKDGESDAEESSGAIKAGKPRVSGGGGSFLPGHLGSAMFTNQLSTVPVVNMLLGSVVGLGAAKAVLGHFSVMVKDISQLFVAGPPVVSHAMGYDISKEDLGDWRIHCTNGSVDNLAETEEEAVEMTKQFLSYLPSSVYDVSPRQAVSTSDPADRREEELLTLIPRKRTTTFDVRKAIRLMADKNSFFEIGSLWGTDQVAGFVRFNGYPLGVIASDSRHENGGALTADGCDKLTRHLDLCDLFHIPVLNLVDNPGFAVGVEHETRGTIRKGGEWMVAFSQIKVPIFTVIMRRSFGVAGNNFATPVSRPVVRVTWPAADVGGIPPEGGIEAAYKRQLAEAEDPTALRAELEARIESARGPIGPLSRFQMEEMVDPRDTRRLICEWVDNAYKIAEQQAQQGARPLQFRP